MNKKLTMAERVKVETEILTQLGNVFDTQMDDLPGIEHAAQKKGFSIKVHTDTFFGVEFEKGGIKKSVEVPETCIQPGYKLYSNCIFESCILAMRQIDKEVTTRFIREQTTTRVWYVVGFTSNDGLTYDGEPVLLTAEHFQRLSQNAGFSPLDKKAVPQIISIVEVPVMKEGVSMLEFYGASDSQLTGAEVAHKLEFEAQRGEGQL